MSGITELDQLLSSMSPELMEEEFVFCTVEGDPVDYLALSPLATFREQEGFSLVLIKTAADHAGLAYEGTFKQITLTVHSSLDAVGLTAAVSGKLTEKGISANVIAAYFHDHIFVPTERADEALAALQSLSAA